MPTLQETAYPRLKSRPSARDLAALYTPSPDEIALAQSSTHGEVALLGFLVLLKTFQRLGYFILVAQVPSPILEQIARATHTEAALPALSGYDTSGTRFRHLNVIRQHLQIRPSGPHARHAMLLAMKEAARTKEHLADLVNVGIEELIRQRYELPGFDTLARGARHVRAVLYRQFYHQVEAALTKEEIDRIEALFVPEPSTRYTPWNTLKQEPGNPSLTHLKSWLDRLAWLAGYPLGETLLAGIPDAKVRHFAAEAKTLDAARLLAMEPRKRHTLAASLLRVQSARVRDDLAEMLIKRMAAIHQKGKEALQAYHASHQQRTDELVRTLRELITAYRTPGTDRERLAALEALLPDRGEDVLRRCGDHLTYAGDNYLPFLWPFFKSHRAPLFRLLRSLSFRATTQDTAFEKTLRFVLDHEHQIGEWWLLPKAEGGEPGSPIPDLSWIPDAWWRLISEERTREAPPRRLRRRPFEACVFSQLREELKSGDLCILGSDQFSDYRDQLLSWEEYHRDVADYGKQVGLPIEGAAFVAHMKTRLTEEVQATDQAFPDNADLRIEKGEPILRRPERVPLLSGLREFELTIAERLEPSSVLEVLRDTDHWLHWTRFFGPISGHDAKLDDAPSRYLATVFGYGCHLGPTQTARSLGTVDRRQLAWIHRRHITEEGLDRAIREVINAYHRFALPRQWGSGKHASADGTKWDLYEQNLLAEYHIR